jgi:squalene-hopene/tetraprenyl-beta-curcumene cyclase
MPTIKPCSQTQPLVPHARSTIRSDFALPTALMLLLANVAVSQTTQPTTRPASHPTTTRPAIPMMPALPPDLAKDTQRAIDRALDFLASTQDADGGWTKPFGPAVTAIVGQGFAQSPRHGPTHPVVARALAHIQTFEQADGGIYERQQNLANYQTSVVLMMLATLDDPAQRQRVARAQAFLKKLQYAEDESIDLKNPWYGGAGYNETKRPDLSNTQMMLEALHQSGLSKDDPVYKRALAFVSRCQMNDATNDQPFADGASDGGFIYSPNGEGESKASEEKKEGAVPLRAYGSMTYSGFKSLLYAGVERNDPRILATLEWIRRKWSLDVNPGMPNDRAKQGLYYYYHVFARALAAWGEPVITDATGQPHNWREELCRKLIALQQPDGSWTNEQDRWLEGDANYVTGLTILSLQTALGQDTRRPTTQPAKPVQSTTMPAAGSRKS